MSLPKSIVTVKRFVSWSYVSGKLHLFDCDSGGHAICGTKGHPTNWVELFLSAWDKQSDNRCGRCEWSLRRRERAALREKAE